MARSRKRYIDSIPIETAQRLWSEQIDTVPYESESVCAPESVGRILADTVISRISSPHYHAAAMDGIAVKAESTFGASEATPVRLKADGSFVWVDTGDPMPESMDAVIMSEDINWVDGHTAELSAAAAPYQHVRAVGEDIVASEMLFAEGHVVAPADIGALLAAGIWRVPVWRKPVVAIIPTGDEIVEPEERLDGEEPRLKRGDILESNSYVQAALVDSWGGIARRFGIVPDELESLKLALSQALDVADVVIINAGSSGGSEDFTAEAISALGEVTVHGIAQRPGKPVILGHALRGGRRKPIVGVPGYPVSAFLTFDTFVRPVVRSLAGLAEETLPSVEASLTRKIASPAGVEEFIRVKLGRVSEKLIASPISRGAGVITSIVRADGILRVPRLAEGLEEGASVGIRLLRPLADIEKTAVVIGSHDPGLDLLGSLMKRFSGVGLSSSHVGSLGGIMALRRGEAHAAGTHLIDEATGEYNIAFLERFLPGMLVMLLTIAQRRQGLVVLPGNPKQIFGIDDLKRPGVRIVNRQRGAGTRILLDLMLKNAGIDPDRVDGYTHDEFTHTAVAASVASGVADCGLAVYAAAKALKLDFVDIAMERYELAIPESSLADWRVNAMIEAVNSQEFAEKLHGLGGYDTTMTGEKRWCGLA